MWYLEPSYPHPTLHLSALRSLNSVYLLFLNLYRKWQRCQRCLLANPRSMNFALFCFDEKLIGWMVAIVGCRAALRQWGRYFYTAKCIPIDENYKWIRQASPVSHELPIWNEFSSIFNGTCTHCTRHGPYVIQRFHSLTSHPLFNAIPYFVIHAALRYTHTTHTHLFDERAPPPSLKVAVVRCRKT